MKVMIRKLTQTQMIVIGYALIILIGSLFLMLPAASRDGLATSFPDALFTATSASCVTGLVIADTFNKWTMFGQCIILALIQIGGLGFMTIGVFFAIILRRKIGLWMRGTLQESVNILQIGGIVRLAKRSCWEPSCLKESEPRFWRFASRNKWDGERLSIMESSTPFPHSAMPDSI